MRHESFLRRLEGLDNKSRLPLGLALHRARCPECRRSAERLAGAVQAYREPEILPLGRIDPLLLDERIMTAVRLLPRPRHIVSTRDWLAAGLIIAASTALVPLGEGFDFVKELFGASYALPLALVLGLVIAGYGAVFIGTHLEELGPLVDRARHAHRKA